METQQDQQPQQNSQSQDGQQVFRILRDQIWQFIAAFLTLVGIIAAILIFYIDRSVKQLQVVVLSSAPLVNIDPEIADQIEVFYRGEPIENIAFVDLRLENAGNQPILEADYSRPVIFSFPDFWEVVSPPNVLIPNPPNLGLVLTSSVNKAQMEPTLLNPGDSATIRFTVIGRNATATNPTDVPEPIPAVDARIAGVGQVEVETLDEALARSEPIYRRLLVVYVLAALIELLALKLIDRQSLSWLRFLLIIIFLLTIVILIYHFLVLV